MPAGLLIEEAREGSDTIHVAKVDISDAFGGIQDKGTWEALRDKLGCSRALPLFGLLVGTLCKICWSGQVLEESTHLRQGGRQGAVDMPTVWEAFADHTFGAMFDKW